MITVQIENRKTFIADSINNFSIEPDEENNKIKIYRNNELLGNLIDVYGISIDDFLDKAKLYEAQKEEPVETNKE